MIQRLSRLRKTQAMRDILTETKLTPSQFIAPIFIRANITGKHAIGAMPGIFQLSLSCLKEEVRELIDLGIRAVILFGIPETKDEQGSSSLTDDGIVQRASRLLAEAFPELLIIADVCFCQYTSHGHCGVIKNGKLNHDATLPLLVKQALSLAKAGVHWVAPSGMIDGMVAALRTSLDANGFYNTAILSYAVKYQSQLYAPFREAAHGAPTFGNRACHQMNPANALEALREAKADIQEGADIIMVKPAGFYLDVILRVKEANPEIPLCAYQVGGEYALIKQSASLANFDEVKLMYESLLAIKRAGADLIISYFAKQFAASIHQ